MNKPHNTHTSEEEKLPFDLRTVLLSIRRRWSRLAVILLVSCIVAAAGGWFFGTQVYEAETVLLYKPEEGMAPSLQTQMNMVKVAPNLNEVSRRLGIEKPLETLSEACDVQVQQNTSLLILHTEWNSPYKAADIANTLREVFVDQQQRIRKTVVGNRIQSLENHLEFVRQQLESADEVKQEFASANGLNDMDTEAQEYLDRLAEVDQLYERAQVEKEVVQRYMSNPNQNMQEVGLRAAQRYRLPAELDGFAEMDTRIQGILSAIQGEKAHNMNLAELEKVEKEFERAQKLWDRGLISESLYQSTRAAYEKQKMLTTDTDEVEAWKKQLGKLMEERTKRLEEARQQVKAKLANLPQMQRKHVSIRREVAFWEGQKKELEEQLAQARRAYDSMRSDFSVISEAEAIPLPVRSNRRLLAIAILALGCALGTGGVFATELLDKTVRSRAEYDLNFTLPLLEELPSVSPEKQLFPARTDSALIGFFRVVARKIRQIAPGRGACVLITGARHGEGTTMTATNLAACFGRQDERVLLIDAQAHSQKDRNVEGYLKAGPDALMVDEELWEERSRYVACELIQHDGQPLKGLGEYLSFQADRLEEIVWPTVLPGVECIPRVGETVVEDLVCSNRMQQLLEEASRHYSLILIDAPPVLSGVDADMLAQWSDTVVFVMRSRKCPVSTLQKAIDRLQLSGTPIAGTILNDVDPLFMEDDGEDIDAI